MEVGDLITMYRRTNPGLGIVLENVLDISYLCRNGMRDIEVLVEMWNEADNFSSRTKAINEFMFYSKMPKDIADVFLLTNNFYRYTTINTDKTVNQIKLRYIKIIWVSPPSDYSIRISRKKIEWYPTQWARKVKTDDEDLTKE